MRHRSLACAMLVTAVLTPATAASAASPQTGTAGVGTPTCTWRSSALSVPAGETGEVTATDGAGGFAGVARANGVTNHVVAWKDGKYTDYGRIESIYHSKVNDESRSGTVVGTAAFSAFGSSASRAFRSTGGRLEVLPIPSGYSMAGAVAVNDAGDVTGYVWKSGANNTAVRWPADRPGTVVVLPGLTPGYPYTRPIAVDEDGSMLVETTQYDVAIWRDGVVTPLEIPPGVQYPQGVDLSNGRAVGYGTYADGTPVGLYWDQQGTGHVLPNSSHHISNGNPLFTINRDGLIIGRIDEAHGGDDSAGTGYGVWSQGAWVSTFGDLRTDFPVKLGDDGTVGGYRIAADGHPRLPYAWRCR
ncbi:hypothetical protein Ppa06_39590 [Planomonospora parontospora subsp. parontospora]|uniref:Uncharacterized protein n=2 Tax=Planomonospora parontospora TaxID=58119 RepID=A0AA37BIC0_9ACTN|nr:hypothetical protein [Planomonospora parontospora]GGK76252.1 hypothetical protein GCM10010126_39330 [Planomonospora parontospora]GII10161.1 hypothetical protein Ppa06_39590 [Planomonospora parontospora subsp. parontospora]